MQQLHYVISYLKNTWGNNFVKVLTLTLGLSIGLVLFARIAFDLSYDRFWADAEHIYQVQTVYTTGFGSENAHTTDYSNTFQPVAPTIPLEIPGVVAGTSILRWGERVIFDGEDRYAVNCIYADTMFFQTLTIPILSGSEMVAAANAIGLAARLLRHGVADRVVAGGCDALCRFTLNGFKSLMILDEQPCRPFDASRAGLNLGEGAAYVVLERAGETAHRPYCYVAGFANANDAYHQTASSPDGEGDFLAMSGALRQAGIEPREVDWVNAHGTGTPNNDLAESRALRRLFGAELPPVSSTKATTGHTLAAAGAIEAVISVLALHHGECYPTLRFAEPDPEGDIRPLDCLTRSDLRCVLSNSFGFGGNCASLLLCREP